MQPGAKVLDIGCGTGYLCAAFYELVKDPENVNNLKHTNEPRIIGIDHIEGITDMCIKCLERDYTNPLYYNQIKIICGDGQIGYEKGAPYDLIHVGAALSSLPYELI